MLVDPADVLRRLGAPDRLVRHGSLVAEAAEEILAFVMPIAPVDAAVVRSGAWLHDAGKARHRSELDGPGNAHEEDGEAMLLALGVDARIARTCWSHARWRSAVDVTIEDLLVALADTLWKGKRSADLEERVIDTLAVLAKRDRWDLFTTLDDGFERVAAGGFGRLDRS